MKRELRRKDRGISDEEAMQILLDAEYGVLSTVSEEGKPYGVPLNYCVINRIIYFHCALEGQKLDNINFNKCVSFCVVGKTELLPEKFGTKYESVIIEGLASEAEGAEKQAALEGLLKKYSRDYIDKGLDYIESLKDRTKVIRLVIEKISGKAKR